MPNSMKADKYLKELDDGLCEGNWDAILELVRKVRKHAPGERDCFATAAETEHAIFIAQPKPPTASRPGTAVSVKDVQITNLLPKLQEAIEGEHSHLQDKFQAQVCVGWLHWVAGDYTLAAQTLPNTASGEYAPLAQREDVSEWTRVCMLKAAYLKANCLSREGERVAALSVFEKELGSLRGLSGQKALHFWAELFLTEFAMLQSQAIERGDKSLEDANSLTPFRSWARYWEATRSQGRTLIGGHGFRGAVPRRRVWNEYYTAISGIVEHDLPFPTDILGNIPHEASARSQLRIELKKTEAAYEALLLTETSFPRADEEREEVEKFVKLVMKNWHILGGRNWHEMDLGAGGKEGLSRGVLETLYRAATKTYHSTSILRHLFTVHLAVAEFELAFKAFDSYMDIVKKGKARVDKTGQEEPSLDDDATFLETISTAVTALCKYGHYDAAEKAQKLGAELEGMLQKLPAPLPRTDSNISTLEEENANGTVARPRLAPRVNALAWQAVGLSLAEWSQKSYDAAARTGVQAKAIKSFQRSLSPETGNPTDVRTLFTLGLLLAEQRELTAAIDIVKAALMSNKKAGDVSTQPVSYWRERSLIPLWHLLALLLSARQDYLLAARACEGAFEQFDDPSILFGTQSLQGSFRSDHLNEAEAKNEKSRPKGLVDEMEDDEKEGIVEVKVTQLALLEILEGPEVAVNASHELLVLYARLFGTSQSVPMTPQRSTTAVPQSSAGTLRSVRGSIFGSKARSLRQISTADGEKLAPTPERPERPETALTTVSSATQNAPTIQITKDNDDSEDARSRQTSRAASMRGRRSESAKRTNSLKRSDSSAHQRRAVSSHSTSHQPTVIDGDAYFTPLGDGAANERPDFFAWSSKTIVSSMQSFSKDRGLARFDSSGGVSTASIPLTLDSLTAPNPLPVIQFPQEQVRRQRQAVLIKVWLVIAGFYRRAGMFKDCKGAIEEARKLVDTMELDLAKEVGSSTAGKGPAWGGRKSADELWADVRSEMGALSVSEAQPYDARAHFEEALLHYPNHPAAIVGLANILLDIYSEVLLPSPAIPGIVSPDGEPAGTTSNEQRTPAISHQPGTGGQSRSHTALPTTPLGLGGSHPTGSAGPNHAVPQEQLLLHKSAAEGDKLAPPYKAVSLPLVDRLAARDRAYGLLSGLTKLGTGWNYSEAWFALARAHEESGQLDKAKEALWWCVELEEGKGVRDWTNVGIGGYVL